MYIIAVNSFDQYDEIDTLIAMSAYTRFEDVVIDNLNPITQIQNSNNRPILLIEQAEILVLRLRIQKIYTQFLKMQIYGYEIPGSILLLGIVI